MNKELRYELARECEISTDGRVVWINSRFCIARFGPRGMNIHGEKSEAKEQMNRSDWDRFVSTMQDLFGVTIAEHYMPKFLGVCPHGCPAGVCLKAKPNALAGTQYPEGCPHRF